MALKLKLHTAPPTEPITRDEAKAHCRITGTDEHPLIDALIIAARQLTENATNRALITQTWKLYLDKFPGHNWIDLPWAPLQSVTSIEYVDSKLSTVTFNESNYHVDTISEPGRVILKDDIAWPETARNYPNAITITYVVGYANAAAVPEDIKLAIKILFGHWFENREASAPGIIISDVPKTFDWILMPRKVFR